MTKRIRPLSTQQQSVLLRLRRGRKLMANIFGGAYFAETGVSERSKTEQISMRTIRVLLDKGLIVNYPIPGRTGISEYVLAGLPPPNQEPAPSRGQVGTV